MYRFTRILRALVVPVALSIAASCAQQASPPPQAAATDGPELAGAWYQVYFDTNSSEINARGRKIVDTVAYIVANAGPTRVTVIGRTDRVGAPPDNMALAHQRANTVRDALILAGVPAAHIDTSWTGEGGKQAMATADDAAAPKNRVVDITVVKEPQ
jgi:OOP family OmpA-OmpF porin